MQTFTDFRWKMGSPGPRPAGAGLFESGKTGDVQGRARLLSRKPCLGSFLVDWGFPYHPLPPPSSSVLLCFPYNKGNFFHIWLQFGQQGGYGDVFIKLEKKDATMTDLQNYKISLRYFFYPSPLVQQEVPFTLTLRKEKILKWEKGLQLYGQRREGRYRLPVTYL